MLDFIGFRISQLFFTVNLKVKIKIRLKRNKNNDLKYNDVKH